ncbi:hypothetical protein [Deinococcus multiflagellatus]|uniref:hypothetical protein n=1 Tax=Deinococcus multiflagellatus TaxID=1656887 RepID=UPI001CCEC639|nr:hypothetical protein [Deinococcus multiflagellatus]MBZ9711747.1 hypothetical protein [Deinococcus multiflagellatus]
MRTLLTVLLLSAPAAAASLSSSFTVPGHALGSFGQPESATEELGGGAAWSADGAQVYTLDTTRVLNHWRVGDGALLGTRRLAPPAALPDAGPWPTTALRLNGTQGGALQLEARSFRQGQPAALSYTLKLQGGASAPPPPCPSSRRVLQVCAGAATLRAEGRTLTWTAGGVTRTRTLPAPGRVLALALNAGGTQAAVLVVEPQTDWGLHGRAALLLWAGDSLRRLSLGPVLSGTPARLNWTPAGWLLAAPLHDDQTGGVQPGEWLSLHRPDGERRWQLSPDLGLRGLWPSPDGQRFVTIRGGSVPEVRRTVDGTLVLGLGEAVAAAVPLAGQRALLALQGGGGAGRVARLQQGSLRTLSPLGATALAAHPDGGRFAAAQGPDVRLHGPRGEVLRRWKASAPVVALAFTPDGQALSAWTQSEARGEVRAWRLNGTPLPLPAGTVFPLSSVLLTRTADQGGPQATHRERLSAQQPGGPVLWQTPWRRGSLSAWPAADGRSAALWSQHPNSQSDPVITQFWRVALHSGQAGPTLNMAPTTRDPNSGWTLAALRGDGRRALLQESTGDGCGWGLYGFALADLFTAQRLPTPPGLASGYARRGGCGFGVPLPQTTFDPDGRLLVQDGNRLDWWTIAQGVVPRVPAGNRGEP